MVETKAEAYLHLFLVLLPKLLLLLALPPLSYAKSVIEPCKATDSCFSLVSYVLPWDSELAEIAFRFQINISALLGANSIDPTKPPFPNTHVLRGNTLVKVPVSCSCMNGIRRAPVTYTVLASDTSLDAISKGFGGLVSADQIRSVNNKITSFIEGRKILVPVPCTCFGNVNNGVPSIYMSYAVQRGERLSSIATRYGTTVHQLEAVNGLPDSHLHPSDVIAIPLPACSSANQEWKNDGLVLANNSYALTANDCIKCRCGPNDLNLQCRSSGIGTSCPSLQCNGSDLLIGQELYFPSKIGCNVSQCVYRGYSGGNIFSSLVKQSYAKCPGGNKSSICIPPMGSSTWKDPLVSPLNSSSTSQGPTHASNHAFMCNFKLHFLSCIFALFFSIS